MAAAKCGRRAPGISRSTPSLEHALVSLDGDLIDVADTPVLRDGSGGRAAVNAPLRAEALARRPAREAICEFVSARPKAGAVGAFSFARFSGVIEGACAVLKFPIRFLTAPRSATQDASGGRDER
jgi:hypothetical protein